MATERELALVAAALRAAAKVCDARITQKSYPREDAEASACGTAILSLDRAAIVASVPQPAEQPEDERAQRAREIIEQLDALDASKKPGGGVHGQILGMESWVIRTNGYGLQCLYDAQVLIDEVLDPFGRRKTQSRPALSSQEQVEPTDAEIFELVAEHEVRGDIWNGPAFSHDGILNFSRALLSANQGK